MEKRLRNQEAWADRIKIKVLRELCRNARQPITNIAKQVGIKPETAARHIKELQASGVVQRCLPIVDFAQLDLQASLVTWTLKDVTPEAERRALNFFLSHPDVTAVIQVRDGVRFVTLLIVKCNKDLESVLSSMKKALPNLLVEKHECDVIFWMMPNMIPERLFTEALERSNLRRTRRTPVATPTE